MRRTLKLLIGLCMLAGVCFVSAYRAGLVHEASAITAQDGSTAIAPVPGNLSPATNTPPANPSRTEASAASTTPPGSDDGSTFVALRYDKNRVFFQIGDQRSQFQLSEDQLKKLHALGEPIAKFGGGTVWETDPELVNAHRDAFERAHPGEEWQLEVSADSRMPFVVQKLVAVELGCFAAPGFLAEVAPSSQAEFAASPQEYFLIHKSAGASREVSSRKQPPMGPLADWKLTPELRNQIEPLLNIKMKDEIARVRAEAASEYERSEAVPEWKTWATRWKQFDERLANGQGKLDYETQAFQLSPDDVPRLFVRARWTLDEKPAFLLSLWLRADSAVLAVESVDASKSGQMRSRDFIDSALDLRDIGIILNVFDRHHDRHGELLIYTSGYEGFEIRLFRHTNAGLVPTQISHGGGC